MYRCKVVYFLDKKKESATFQISKESDAEVEFSDGRRKKIPLQSAHFDLKGDNSTTLEISWTDEAGKNYIYCNDKASLSHLNALHGSSSFISKISLISGRWEKSNKSEKNRVPVYLTIIGALLVCSYFLINSLAPIAAKVIPAEWEQKIGSLAYEQFLLGKTKNTSPELLSVISRIVERIDKHDGVDIEYEFCIIDSTQVNAFALPGGFIVLTSELIKRSQRAEEVAGVLAHELTHVLERHSTERLLRQAGIGITVAVVLGDTSSIARLVEVASGLEGLSFSREQEKRADDGAVKILISAGISPSHFISFFEILKNDAGLSSDSIPEMLSTHPLTDKRIERLSAAQEPDTLQPFNIDWDSAVRQLK